MKYPLLPEWIDDLPTREQPEVIKLWLQSIEGQVWLINLHLVRLIESLPLLKREMVKMAGFLAKMKPRRDEG